MQRNILKWFGHVERMESKRLTKRVYDSEVEGVRGRSRPRSRRRDGVGRYLRKGGGSELGGR